MTFQRDLSYANVGLGFLGALLIAAGETRLGVGVSLASIALTVAIIASCIDAPFSRPLGLWRRHCSRRAFRIVLWGSASAVPYDGQRDRSIRIWVQEMTPALCAVANIGMTAEDASRGMNEVGRALRKMNARVPSA